jgi:putative FmdB family regulatory protein
MPIYEYRCGKCKAVFEVLRERSQRDTEAVCTCCGSRKTGRQMSSFSGHVSGAGSGSSSVAGSGGCGSCKAASCAGCSRN